MPTIPLHPALLLTLKPTVFPPPVFIFLIAQSPWNWSMLAHIENKRVKEKPEAKRKKNTETLYKIKGWFLHKGHIFHAWRHCLASVWIRTLAECLVALCPVQGARVDAQLALRHWKLKEAIFSPSDPWERTKTLEALLHLCIHTWTHVKQYWNNDSSLIGVGWKDWMRCYIQQTPYKCTHGCLTCETWQCLP